mmetsp:Transcript_2295/g.7971  ORF Transcript_2295/g.7971 Transcript_2295/m.7971 type:complete len:206 (-) Transcript_2295:8535-9152(-)
MPICTREGTTRLAGGGTKTSAAAAAASAGSSAPSAPDADSGSSAYIAANKAAAAAPPVLPPPPAPPETPVSDPSNPISSRASTVAAAKALPAAPPPSATAAAIAIAPRFGPSHETRYAAFVALSLVNTAPCACCGKRAKRCATALPLLGMPLSLPRIATSTIAPTCAAHVSGDRLHSAVVASAASEGPFAMSGFSSHSASKTAAA